MDLDQISKAIDPEEFVLESFKESSGAKSQPDGESSLGCPQKAESDLELECHENYVWHNLYIYELPYIPLKVKFWN